MITVHCPRYQNRTHHLPWAWFRLGVRWASDGQMAVRWMPSGGRGGRGASSQAMTESAALSWGSRAAWHRCVRVVRARDRAAEQGRVLVSAWHCRAEMRKQVPNSPVRYVSDVCQVSVRQAQSRCHTLLHVRCERHPAPCSQRCPCPAARSPAQGALCQHTLSRELTACATHRSHVRVRVDSLCNAPKPVLG